MIYALITALLALLIYWPSLWVRLVMRRHGADRDDLPGTGGELAQHLIRRFELEDLEVEETQERGDHYDPAARRIRLGPSNFHGRSLTAVAVAAHEVGHAIQFARNEPVSRLRGRYLPTALRLRKTGIIMMTLLPVVALLLKAPPAVFALIAVSIGLQLIGALFYLIVLPEEWDASFNKALPLLVEGDYIQPADLPAVRRVLQAAAFTYFAGALADLLNLGRWLLILRR